MFLWAYINGLHANDGHWITTSLEVAHAAERGPWLARQLWEWTCAFVKDQTVLPLNVYGRWNVSLLEDEDLAQEIHLHFQSIGKYVRAMDIVQYLDTPEMKMCLKLKKMISLATAQCWMYPKGQFVDGHEGEDVVAYRQDKFLPAWKQLEPMLRNWDENDVEVVNAGSPLHFTVVWHHNESTYYANDCHKICWVHKDETAIPYAKGKGASLMVADFVSADYGWLCSVDQKEESHVLFKAGKAQDGYFTNEDILEQASMAMDILTKHFPSEDHVLNWGVEVSMLGMDGKPIYGLDGKIWKEKVCMGDAMFADGTPQCLYFPEGHTHSPGVFKGMVVLLGGRGYAGMSKICAECKKFKCAKGLDFANIESLLKITCKACGFHVIFLPKFHCKLNFIEQCWGYSKRVYQQYPVSSKEEDLERNVLTALNSVPLASMWHFACRSCCFMDGYWLGLNGKQAAWAAKHYCSHRTLPESIMRDLEDVRVR
ncbi:hypothetical protein K439DRAFT_1648626 [Ramaria rubella]|nr:hypothetical protein K439DRAFT_1648626 [Ramaria rubella]